MLKMWYNDDADGHRKIQKALPGVRVSSGGSWPLTGKEAARAREALNDIALAFDAIIQQHAELRQGQREHWPAYP